MNACFVRSDRPVFVEEISHVPIPKPLVFPCARRLVGLVVAKLETVKWDGKRQDAKLHLGRTTTAPRRHRRPRASALLEREALSARKTFPARGICEIRAEVCQRSHGP
jgi:hypothetical protein